MNVSYSSNSLKESLTKPKKMIKVIKDWGHVERVSNRIRQLEVAENLRDFACIGATGIHKMKHGRKECVALYAVNKTFGVRIVFTPKNGLDISNSNPFTMPPAEILKTITEIEINYFGDYHRK